jgi:transcriptional regulator with XRE-family HTH domain
MQARPHEQFLKVQRVKRDWVAMFDELKTRGDYVSDAEFAAHLGVSRAQISAWRCGKTNLGTITKLRLLDALGGESLSTAVSSMLSDSDPEFGPSQQKALLARVRRKRHKRMPGEDPKKP